MSPTLFITHQNEIGMAAKLTEPKDHHQDNGRAGIAVCQSSPPAAALDVLLHNSALPDELIDLDLGLLLDVVV